MSNRILCILNFIQLLFVGSGHTSHTFMLGTTYLETRWKVMRKWSLFQTNHSWQTHNTKKKCTTQGWQRDLQWIFSLSDMYKVFTMQTFPVVCWMFLTIENVPPESISWCWQLSLMSAFWVYSGQSKYVLSDRKTSLLQHAEQIKKKRRFESRILF